MMRGKYSKWDFISKFFKDEKIVILIYFFVFKNKSFNIIQMWKVEEINYAPTNCPRFEEISVKNLWNKTKSIEIINKSFPDYINDNDLPHR